MRPSTPRAHLSPFILAAVIAVLAPVANAQLSGNISGNLSGTHLCNSITVPVGAVLTIQAGSILKFTTDASLTVNGTLVVFGVVGNAVVFTDDGDDTAGGDTNGNGPSVGSPGGWRGIVFSDTSDASSLSFADVRFGGGSFFSNLDLTNANITLANCVSRDCFVSGMNLHGNSNPTVTNCVFQNNLGRAIDAAPITALANFSGNSGSGNGTSNSVRVSAGTVSSNLSLAAAAMMAGGIIVDTDIAISSGATLAVGPGVALKFTTARQVSVSGILQANGTALSPVIFTDDADDSVGGDTDGSGLSAGSAGQWVGLVFGPTSDASTLNFAQVRFGGGGFVSNVELTNADITLTNCVIRDCFASGLDLNANSKPTVTNCTFTNNLGRAVDNVAINAVPGFGNNVGSGNVAGSNLRITDGSVTSNLTLNPSAMINGGLIVDTDIVVSTGVTLAVNAGVNVKFTSARELTVNGTLLANGSAGSRVIFTAAGDDTAGGDTNGGGASSGSAGSWRGLVFNANSDASTLNFADVRFGGGNFVANIDLNGADVTLSNCNIRDCFTMGMDLNENSKPTVTNCTFTNNGGRAVDKAHLDAVAGFSNNTGSGNNGTFIQVTSATLSSNLTLNPASMLNGAIIVNTDILVTASATLTLNAGMNMKFTTARQLTVDGTLIANGSSTSPVVFTDDADDTAGGDTDGLGASVGLSGSWGGLVFNATSDASNLNFAEIRFGGASFVSEVELINADITMTNCVVRNCFTTGMDLNNNSRPTVTNCAFTNNGGHAIDKADLSALAGFANNTASGNFSGAGNFIRVTTANVTNAVTVGSQSMINGVVVLATDVTIQPSGTLTVLQGVNLKSEGNREIVVDGSLHMKGTAYEPIVFTALADDSIGGDTNGNGPGSGVPGTIRGITFNAIAQTSSLENVRVRFAGSTFVTGVSSASPNVSLRSVRVESAFSRGFSLTALSGNAHNLVATDCGSHGIQLLGGSFSLVHATSVANGVGIRAEAGWTGTVANSISFANSTNFSNFGAGAQVFNSDGAFAGAQGNLNIDPQFVNFAARDLHLAPTSPCIGAGDLGTAFATIKDHDENSRLLDANLSGAVTADMGAYERGVWNMEVSGTTRIGTTVTFTVTGPPGESIYVFGVLDGVVPIIPWGFLLAGGIPFVTVVPLNTTPIPVGTPVPITLPNDPGIIGFVAAIQTLTTPPGNASVGNFTQLYRALGRP